MSARLLLILVLFGFTGCATAPRVGVRSGFENHVVTSIAVAPIAADKPFGISPSHWRLLQAQAVRQLVEQLGELHFEVISPEALRDTLERSNAWERFEDTLHQPGGLETLFEPNIYTTARTEVQTLRELHDEGILVVPALLFTEVVYHSRGVCTVDPREHNRFARVTDRHGDLEDAPDGPCVVTHVQAKLVDPATGGTMWHNRVLRELRVDEVSDADELGNLEAAVHDVIAGAHGVAPFSPSRGRH